VVGYATVTTHDRPPGSAGVNYKVHLNQFPTVTPLGASSTYLANDLTTSSRPMPSSYSAYKSSAAAATSHRPTAASYSTLTAAAAASPAPAPAPITPYSAVSRRSRAASARSASLPRLYTPSRAYAAPATPSSATLRALGGADVVEAWMPPWRSVRPPAKRHHDDDDEFYRRLRDIRSRATASPPPAAADLDVLPRRAVGRRRAPLRPVSHSPNVIYTGKKIDYGLIPDRPVPPPPPPPFATFSDDNPSRSA